MKYCNKCGARLLENAQMCRKCGKKVERLPIMDILLYIFGILFLVIGIVDIVSTQSGGIADLWMCLAGFTMLPLPYKIVEAIIRNFNSEFKSNNAWMIIIRVLLPLAFFILMILFYKSYVQIVESDTKNEYKEIFQAGENKVYFYGLSEFNVLVGQDYLSLGKAYEQDSGVLQKLVDYLMLDTEYTDGSNLYKNKTYSVLKCSNGDYVIGSPRLEFKKGFCGKDKIPSKKSDKKDVEDDETDKKNDKDKNESKDETNNDNNKNENIKDDIGTGRDESVNKEDGANTNNNNTNSNDSETEDNKDKENESSVSVNGELTSQKIYDVYHNNMLDGRNKYYGKKIKVSTVFNHISKGINNSYVLNMSHIYCTSFLNIKVQNSLADLDRGQSLVVSGIVNEWNEEKSTLELRSCEIVNK